MQCFYQGNLSYYAGTISKRALANDAIDKKEERTRTGLSLLAER